MRSEHPDDLTQRATLGAQAVPLSWIKVNVFVITALALGTAGCVTTTHVVGQMANPKSRVQTNVPGSNASGVSNDSPVSSDQAFGTDPCEMRLQNIEAAFLLYYSLYQRLPARLNDLVALSSDDLPLSCPVSHQDYLYFKDGLPLPGSQRKVIVSDATPAHLGKRWCIVMAPSAQSGVLELEPSEVPESVFRGLQPNP